MIIKRQNFTPSFTANFLLDNLKRFTGISTSDGVNRCIKAYFTPLTPELKVEADIIFSELDCKKEDVSESVIQGCLSRSVLALKKHPISDNSILTQIMMHYRTSLGHVLCYDYNRRVDLHDDKILRSINDMLFSIDNNYNLGKREIGERSRTLLNNWEKVCQYEETYEGLAAIIRCEDVHMPVGAYNALVYLVQLDGLIRNNPTTIIAQKYPSNISLNDRISSIRYEILVYYGNTAYLQSTNDKNFELVRGTKLWDMWYGTDNENDKCISNLNTEVDENTNAKELFDELLRFLKAIASAFDNAVITANGNR